MDKLRSFLEANYKGTQTFNTRNIVGDRMKTVYCDGGVMVDYCIVWNYLGIFGLTEEQYRSLSDILSIE